jgi:plastocyanin
MLEQIWTGILDLLAQFVTPDWGKLISLMPVAIILVAIVVVLWLFARLMRAAPARRGKARAVPKTPSGIHMPGPSFAPPFAAAGLFLILLGLVFGGISVVLGAIALCLTLLYWLAEGIRNYDHDIGPTATSLPAAVHDGPPEGVHMPGPSWRPFIGAFGMFAILLGLVFGGWLLAAGIIVFIATLVGWLFDAVRDYRAAVRADTTGHLDAGPEPPTPRRLFTALTVLIVGAAVLQSGIFVAGSANGGTPGASGGPPAGSGAPPAPSGGSASGAPSGSGGPAAGAGDVTIQAKGVAFVQTTFTAPAGKPFTIAFDNEDPGTPHDVELQDAAGTVAFKGDVFNGVATKVYDVPALKAGTYKFSCIVHPTMTGTATIQ